MLKMIEHVQLAMPAGEEDIARRFYAGALGLIEVPKPDDLAKRGGCWFESGPVKVHLGVDPQFHPATKAHPAFIVDDLDAMRASLVAAGISCTNDDAIEGFRRFFVSDPFGNRIELMERID